MNGWTDDLEATYGADLSRAGTLRGRMQRACLLLYGAHAADRTLPTSIRFLFYELVQRGVIPKHRLNKDGRPSTRRADTDVSEAMTYLREAGLVDWRDIVDETRDVNAWAYAASAAAYLRDELGHLRLDAWGGEPPPVIVCESRSLAGVLRQYAARYQCPITSTNGQSSGSLVVNGLAPLLDEPRPVLYFGDLDLAGGHIEESTLNRLRDADADVDDWTRVAITSEQVAAHALPSVVKTDGRYRPARAYEAWETEALSQRVIVDELTGALDAIRADRQLDGLADVRARERSAREHWRSVIDGHECPDCAEDSA